MTESTLQDIRAQIDALAVDVGQYTIVCARTGEHPVPITGLQFPDREAATRAARAAQCYRARLRRYDSRMPYHDLIVCEGMTNVRGQTDRTEAEPNWLQRFWATADRELTHFRVICEDEGYDL